MKRTLQPAGGPPARGALLIEVLIAIVICAFGLLGFAAMQARAAASEFESYQRSQALVLVQDMVNRMNANRGHVADYVTAGLIGSGTVQDCSGKSGADYDLCDWANMIRGSTITSGGSTIGSMTSARGRITQATDSAGNTTTGRYTVCVVWQGNVPTGKPGSACGSGDATFPDDTLRRVAESTVCIGQLQGAATGSRC